MSRISSLRNRSTFGAELCSKRVERVCSVVQDYLQSDVAKLTIANHFADNEEVMQTDMTKFANELSTVMADTVTDGVMDFEDNCRVRGFSEEQVKEVVDAFSKVFLLDCQMEYKLREMKVADFFKANPVLYDSLGMYRHT